MHKKRRAITRPHLRTQLLMPLKFLKIPRVSSIRFPKSWLLRREALYELQGFCSQVSRTGLLWVISYFWTITTFIPLFFAFLPCFSRPFICLRPLIRVLFPQIFNVISCQGFTPIFICLFIFTHVLTQMVSFPSNSNWHLVFHLPEPNSVAAPRLIWLETYRQQTFTFSTSNIIWDLNPQHWRCREIDI